MPRLPALLLTLLMTAPAVAAEYPAAERGDVVDEYHGVQVADPYRWLEDATAPATRTFIDAQNELFLGYIDKDTRDAIRDRLQTLIDYPRVGVPSRAGQDDASGLDGRGTQMFVSTNDGLQNHSVLNIRGPATDGKLVPLLNPNDWSDDGTTALSGSWASPDGTSLAYGISEGGSDDKVVKILDLRPGELGEHYDETLRDMRFTWLAWHPGGRGFWYSKYPVGERLNEKLYWHELESDPAEDVEILAFPDDPELGVSPDVTNEGEFLLVYTRRGTDRRAGLHYKVQCCNPAYAGGFRELFPPEQAEYAVVDDPQIMTPEGKKAVMAVLTNRDAPAGKFVLIDPAKSDPEHWTTILPEPTEPGTKLEEVVRAGDRYVALYMQDAKSVLKHYDLEGGDEKTVELPAVGSVSSLDGDPWHDTLYFGFTGYTYPSTPFELELATNEITKLNDVSPAGFEPEAYESKQVFFESKDGTKVPMFITHKKGLAMSGENPTILYGYGGFDISLTPGFSSARLAWLEQGGVYAVANLRGGGEYGQPWHEAGMLDKKQNVFDDFIAAAEFLIGEGYTNSDKLAIEGGSNGGLLVAAVGQQRPDLLGAVHSAVPVTDMLRYQTFGTGRFWTVEYGDANDDADTFANLMTYSPLHTVQPDAAYPPILVTTGDGDDRVVPAHSLKWVATLQHANPQTGGPFLLRYDVGTGHGAGKPLAKSLDELAETYAFFAKALDMTWSQVPQP